jgi:hypothetical protein
MAQLLGEEGRSPGTSRTRGRPSIWIIGSADRPVKTELLQLQKLFPSVFSDDSSNLDGIML